MKQPSFEHNGTVTIAHLYYKDKIFSGQASCAPEDMEFMNDRTGENIAIMRAEIEYLKFVRDCELIPQLEALKELHYSFNGNKNYSENSLEARRIRKHMYMKEADLVSVRLMLAAKRQELKDYFAAKDKSYQIIRNYRKDKEG